MPAPWSPDSWRSKPIVQVPEYPDQAALEEVTANLRNFPPLVFIKEVQDLKAKLADVAAGNGFLLQGGDCAESFKEHKTDYIRDYFQLFLQMALILTFAGNSQVVKVGRVAGSSPSRAPQRPRKQGRRRAAELSRRHRQRAGVHARGAHSRSASPTAGLSTVGGHAQFPARAAGWRLRLARQCAPLGTEVHGGTPVEQRYDELADEIKAHGGGQPPARHVGREHAGAAHHQLLHQPRGAAAELRAGADPRGTRLMGSGSHVATSGHMLWIGDRTRQPDGAHVEYCRGIVNPIGLKCGPSLEADELLRLIDILNPSDEPGRLTLIGRFGAGKIDKHLPKLIRAVKKAGPYGGVGVRSHARQHHHGGDRLQDAALRQRGERGRAVLRHPPRRGHLRRRRACRDDRPERDGVHGRRHQDLGADLARQYDTGCDPRLNAGQSLELAFRIAEHLKAERSAHGHGRRRSRRRAPRRHHCEPIACHAGSPQELAPD
jgi:3-deoxy-7-phosphoheptulonate synthase